MFGKIKIAAASAIVAFGALAAAPSAANADSLTITYKNGNFGVGISNGYNGYGYKSCTSGKALKKAKWMGVKKAHVAAVTKSKIVVAGKKNGNYTYVTFGKAPNCPIKW